MPKVIAPRDPKEWSLFTAGHTACAGCGQSLGARLVLNAAGPRTILVNATGCLEVFTTRYPSSAWRVPWLHSLFENASAVGSGVEAALKALGKADDVHVIVQGGDGGTADIGFGSLSGMFERGHNILYVCYDNEAYMNTGIQRSGLTPFGASTTTSPVGSEVLGNTTGKKDLPAIAVAHGVPYVATTTVAYPKDLEKKVKKALSIKGPKYIQILVPCPLGWGHDTSLTIRLARLAVQSGIFPVIEVENGKLTSVMRIARKVPVDEYLKPQARFRHLFTPAGREELERVQALADANIERFGLLGSKAG